MCEFGWLATILFCVLSRVIALSTYVWHRASCECGVCKKGVSVDVCDVYVCVCVVCVSVCVEWASH